MRSGSQRFRNGTRSVCQSRKKIALDPAGFFLSRIRRTFRNGFSRIGSRSGPGASFARLQYRKRPARCRRRTFVRGIGRGGDRDSGRVEISGSRHEPSPDTGRGTQRRRRISFASLGRTRCQRCRNALACRTCFFISDKGRLGLPRFHGCIGAQQARRHGKLDDGVEQ